MKIDSGAALNTISELAWLGMKADNNLKIYNERDEPDIPLVAYGKHPLVIIAQLEAKIEIPGRTGEHARQPRTETFTVCKGTTISLMGRSTAEGLRLLKVGPLEIDAVESEPTEFPKVPNYKVKFDIDHSVPGHQDTSLRIPLGQQAEQIRILKDYEARGIIERVPRDENPKFISPQFFVKKANGQLRLVNDNKRVNTAIRILSHEMPTMEHFLPEFAGMEYFSVLDIKDAFLHLELDDEAKQMTTFNTPMGLYRYTRLNFGMNTSPTIFQK